MADGYALALQAALVAALRAHAGVAALVGARVWDEPPKKPERPFLRLGEIVPRPLRSDGARAARVTFGIEAHSRPETAGRVEATRLAEAAVAALDEAEATVAVAGFTLVSLFWITTTVARAPDGESYLAVAAFEALLDG